MWQFLKQLTGLLLVTLLGYLLYHVATQNVDDSQKVLHVAPDSTTTIVGKVLANKTDCLQQSAGSKCFLTLQIGEKNVYVIYNTNDNSFCGNEKTAIDGKTVRANTTVKVYGFYKQEGKTDTVLTCPSAKYFIQTL